MLRKKEYTFRNKRYIDIEIAMDGRYGNPSRRRREKRLLTPEAVAKQNRRNKQLRLWRLIRNNFEAGDYWITLTYRREDRPDDSETVRKDVQKLLRGLRSRYKKADAAFKYIYSIEIGERGGVHCHMIINRISGLDSMISTLWICGHVNITPMYADGHFKDLAEYIGKGSAYSRSRNLEMPKESKRELKAKDIPIEPKPYKGYYVDKDSVYQGINIFNGLPFLHYTMVRIE